MNQIVNVTQESMVTLEYIWQGKIIDKERNKRGEAVKVAREVPTTEARKGIGGQLFRHDPNFKFPIIEMPVTQANRILRSEKRDGTNNFRIAEPIKKKGE